eukprot:29570-Pelagococcus_subviridis.AAC.4
MRDAFLAAAAAAAAVRAVHLLLRVVQPSHEHVSDDAQLVVRDPALRGRERGGVVFAQRDSVRGRARRDFRGGIPRPTRDD